MARIAPGLMIFVSLLTALALPSALTSAVRTLGESAPEALVTGPYQAGDDRNHRLPRATAAGDFNGDGLLDLAISTARGDVLLVRAGSLMMGPQDGTGGELFFRIRGGDAFPGFGSSLAAGDFNGDGISDLLIGAPETGAQRQGAVILLRGRSEFRDRERINLDLLEPGGLVYLGNHPGGRLGHAVVMDDFNGDGLDDAVFSAPGSHGGAGRVHLLRGQPGIPAEVRTVLTSPPTATLVPPADGKLLGWTLSAGDLDNDLRAEIAVTGRRGGGGFLALVGAALAGTRTLDPTASWIGTGPGELALTEPADLDGDNDAELVVAVDGRIWVVDGLLAGFGPVDLEDVSIGGLTAPEGIHLGGSLAAGDPDGDGRDEVLVGIPDFDAELGRPEAGVVALFDIEGMVPRRNAAQVFRLLVIGEEPGDALGSVAQLVDLNGDSRDDLLLGAPNYESTEIVLGNPVAVWHGKLYGISGLRKGVLDLAAFTPEGSFIDRSAMPDDTPWSGSAIGRAVTRGDFDGDGIAEIAVAGSDPAGVWVLRTPVGDRDLARSPVGPVFLANGRQIHALSSGDVDADGRDDLIVVAASTAEPTRGEVHVLLAGPRGFEIGRTQSDLVFQGSPGDRLGHSPETEVVRWASVAVGDLDADGAPDLAIGLPDGVRGLDPSAASEGAVWVLYGPFFPGTTRTLTTPGDQDLLIFEPGIRGLGSSVDTGDRNGDGTMDLLVGTTDSDRVFVMDGGDRPTGMRILTGDLADLTIVARGGFGRYAELADMNGDGPMEILVGAPDFDGLTDIRPDRGGIAVFMRSQFPLGLLQADDPLLRGRFWFGPEAGARLGLFFRTADTDHDGRPEVLALMPGRGEHGALAGLELPADGVPVDLAASPPAEMLLGSERFPLDADAPLAAADTDLDGSAEAVLGFERYSPQAPPRLGAGAVAATSMGPAGTCPSISEIEGWVTALGEEVFSLPPSEIVDPNRLTLLGRIQTTLDDLEDATIATDIVARRVFLASARDRLREMIRPRMDGCWTLGTPDPFFDIPDWVMTCSAQSVTDHRARAAVRALDCRLGSASGSGQLEPTFGFERPRMETSLR